MVSILLSSPGNDVQLTKFRTMCELSQPYDYCNRIQHLLWPNDAANTTAHVDHISTPSEKVTNQNRNLRKDYSYLTQETSSLWCIWPRYIRRKCRWLLPMNTRGWRRFKYRFWPLFSTDIIISMIIIALYSLTGMLAKWLLQFSWQIYPYAGPCCGEFLPWGHLGVRISPTATATSHARQQGSMEWLHIDKDGIVYHWILRPE